jgi:hypothetical protein
VFFLFWEDKKKNIEKVGIYLNVASKKPILIKSRDRLSFMLLKLANSYFVQEKVYENNSN